MDEGQDLLLSKLPDLNQREEARSANGRDKPDVLPDSKEAKKAESVIPPPLYKDLLVMYATPPGT